MNVFGQSGLEGLTLPSGYGVSGQAFSTTVSDTASGLSSG